MSSCEKFVLVLSFHAFSRAIQGLVKAFTGFCSLGGLIKALKGLVEALESLVMAFRIRALRAL